jgi:hypothetical protein
MLRTFLSVVAAALLISVILLTPASSADTGEATIPYGGHRSWSVEMERPFTLSYSVVVLDGAHVNVLVISSDNYSGYLTGSVSGVVHEAGVSNVTNTSVDVEMQPGTYYVVIEAPQVPGVTSNETMVSYRIDTSVGNTEGSSLAMVLGAGAVVLFGTVILFFLDMRVRRKR